MTLYEIGTELEALDNLLDECGGDISSPGYVEAVDRWYAEAKGLEADKFGAICLRLRRIDDQIAAAQAMEDQFRQKRKTLESQAAWEKLRMKSHMEHFGLKKVECSNGFKVSVVVNSAAPMEPTEITVEAVDAAGLGPKYVVLTPSVNTKMVRADLKDGVQLPFARLGERGTHLRVS